MLLFENKLQVNKIGRTLYDISVYVNKDTIRYKSPVDINEEITLHLEVSKLIKK